MKISYVVREHLNLYPPCISQILILKDLGMDITVISGDISENLKNILDEREINYIIIGNERFENKYIGKIQSYYNYRKKIRTVIKNNKLEESVFWFGTAESAFALYPWVNNLRFVFNILELYDTNKFYRSNINRIAKHASGVIANELNRAYIMKNWYDLKKLPFVMPNKPYEHPESKNIDVRKNFPHLVKDISRPKIILYQGLLSSDRDLKQLAIALNELDDGYTLLLMGKKTDNSIEDLKEIYRETYHIEYIPAPDHLKITSHAYIGIANYDDSTLNNIYCAPNKTYEYAGYGIPILGSNVLGLINSIGANKAGLCVDFNNIESIKEAIKTINTNYDFYSNNAKSFFEKTNNSIVMQKVIDQIQKG